jgi:hypothetical protein
MKIVSLVIGVLAVLMGLIWIGQGVGIVRFIPSAMIDQPIWIMWGVLLATVGAGLILLSRRR